MTQSLLTEVPNDFRTDVLQKLRTDVVNVKFTKADGSEREMLCTLIESKIPSDKRPKGTEEDRSTSGSAVRVFDVEKGEWRSFRWNTIISVDNKKV